LWRPPAQLVITQLERGMFLGVSHAPFREAGLVRPQTLAVLPATIWFDLV